MKRNAIGTLIGAATITAVAATGLAAVTALAGCGTGSRSRNHSAGAKNAQYRYYLSRGHARRDAEFHRDKAGQLPLPVRCS
jgi:hypothetical protein